MDNFKVEQMNENYAREIAEWHYDDLYSDYNMPSYEEMQEKGYGLTKSDNYINYLCFVDKCVIAYSSIKKMPVGVFLGIGIKPDFCGRGLGKIFLSKSIDEIKLRYPGERIFLEVRSWNKRAIKSYLSAGFTVTNNVIKKDRLGNEVEFIEMELV